MSTSVGNCAALAANCPNEVVRVLHAPKVTNARNTLPVSFDARRTKPVRRAPGFELGGRKKLCYLLDYVENHGSTFAVSFTFVVG